jgi:hypothetical protein
MAHSKIKKRFSIGTAGILIVACAAASILTYYYLKARAIDGIYRETEIYIGMAEATRTYVKEVEAFYDANVNMDNTWAYPGRAATPNPRDD